MTREQALDLYFMDARCKLIELAAFLDRLDHSGGEADFRLSALQKALPILTRAEEGRAKAVLLALSDPTTEPLAAAPSKGACGAWPGSRSALD
jgi:hypothetical protein